MADLVFTIKTPAELEGVEQAVTRFERMRGAALASGKSVEELDKRIASARASIEAYSASLAKIPETTPIKKLVDESERLQQSLEKLQHASHEARADEAQRQIELRATTATTKQLADESERYQETLEKMESAAHDTRAEQAQLAIDQITAQKSTQAFASSTEGASEKTKLFSGHSKELKKVIVELSREFPIAGFALRALANPIAATLTIAIGLFVAVKRHIEELNVKLDEMEANARKPLGNFAEALREIERAAESSKAAERLDDFSKSIESIHTRADAAVTSIHSLEAAQKELFSAQEAEQLAKVNLAEKQGRITPVQGIAQRSAIRDKFAREQKELDDAARNAEIGTREKEAGELKAKRKEQQGKILSPEQKQKLEALSKSREKGATDFADRAEKQKFDDNGVQAPESDKKAKTLDKAISDLNASIDALLLKRGIVETAHSPLVPNYDPSRDPDVKTINKDRDALIVQRDALEDQKKALLEAAEKAKDLAARYKDQAIQSDEAKKKVAELTQELEKLNAQIEALREAARLSATKGEQTEAAKARTRQAESQTDVEKADDAAQKKEDTHRRNLGEAADRAVNGRAGGAATETPLPDLAAEFDAYNATVISTLGRLQKSIADGRSQVNDIANT